MHGSSCDHRPPGHYRIFPALVAAALIHFVAFSGWSPPPQPALDLRPTVHLELQVTSRTSGSPEPQPHGATTDPPPAQPVQPLIPASPRKTPGPQPSVGARPQPPQAAPEPTAQSPGRETRLPADTAKTSRQTLQQITRTSAEQDPYRIKLAAHLAREMEQRSLPALRGLSRPVTMEIELQLMANGALTRARILKPTGIRAIDDTAYRASLAASPYPEPPATESMLNRFEVTLVFSPKRI